jgi:hypothetical protein
MLYFMGLLAEYLENILIFSEHEEQCLDALKRLAKVDLWPVFYSAFQFSKWHCLRKAVLLNRLHEDVLLIHLRHQLLVVLQMQATNFGTIVFFLPRDYFEYSNLDIVTIVSKILFMFD